jgi:hypothetical protein
VRSKGGSKKSLFLQSPTIIMLIECLQVEFDILLKKKFNTSINCRLLTASLLPDPETLPII